MPLYEHVFLARQDVSNTQVEALTKELSEIITQGGGKIVHSEYWGLKGIAYKIKKNRKAHYTMLSIDSPPAAVAEMERRMGINADIVRFLTVKVEAHETEPSVMMRKSDERSERGERGDRGPRGDRGGFRGDRGDRGPRGDRPPRGDREGGGGYRGDREGGSTFRARPPRDGDSPRPPRDGDGPRGPRPPRDFNPGSEG